MRRSSALVVSVSLLIGITAGVEPRVAGSASIDAVQPGAPRTAPVMLPLSEARLVPGSSIEEATQVRWTHQYEVDLTANDLIDLRIQQDDALAKFTVRNPQGAVAHVATLPSTERLPARLLYIAATTGVHRVEVYTNGNDDERGVPLRFTLEVLAIRPATADDVERVRIAHLADRAGALAMQEKLASLEASIPLFQEAAAGWRALGEPRLEAVTLKSLAAITGLFTRFRATSAEAYRRLVEILRDLGETREEADARQRLAVEYADDGQVARARDAALESIRLAEGLPGRPALAPTLQLVAFLEMRLGNYEESRWLAGRAMEAAIATHDHSTQALALSTLARLQDLSGDVQAAIQQQERAVALSQAGRPRRDLLNTLGLFYLRAGDIDRAEASFTEAASIAGRFIGREAEALTHMGLGDVAMARGDLAMARECYRRVLAVVEKSGYANYRCWIETRIGGLDLKEGLIEDARAHFTSGLDISREVSEPICEAESRAGLADAAFAAGRLDEARAQAVRLVQLHDAFREASTSIDARTLGFAMLAPAYERAVDTTMRLAAGDDASPHIAEALSLNERTLARGLLDALTTERVERGAEVPAALEGERRRLREAWRARVIEHETSLQRNATARATTLAAEIDAVSARLRDIEARIDAANPRHAAFTRPRPLSLDGIRALLDDDTLLVEYALGEARSYVWVVDTKGVRAFTLAARADIEAAVRRAHEDVARLPESAAPAASGARRRASLDAVARLILQPIAPLLTKRRFVIVAPDALALVPFGALHVPSGGRDGVGGEASATVGGDDPLIARHEIVSLPSATVLAALRSLDHKRPATSSTVAVFADPVYERDDPRLSARARPVTTAARRSSTGAADAGREPAVAPLGWTHTRDAGGNVALARLPFSRREAAAIRRYAPAGSVSFVGLDATRERALAGDLVDHRIVHFAAHGLLQPDVPNLSGIALSLVDARGRPRNGFLMLPDVYDLRLTADLVVLSACETALGHAVRGEGVVGLPRGFMYAGAARVVSTLWRVDDEATAALMAAFYRRVLRDGMTPAAALRAAQLDLRAIPRWRSPFFWAGFVLQGDWR